MSSMQMEESLLTSEEFSRMEKLLGKLLIGASTKEQNSILAIHTSLKTIFDAQKVNDDRLNYLMGLTMQIEQ